MAIFIIFPPSEVRSVHQEWPIAGRNSAAHRLEFIGITVRRANMIEWHISLKTAFGYALLPYISPLDLYLLLELSRGSHVCANISKTIKKKLKATSVGELGHLISKISGKAIADAEERLSAGCDLAKRTPKRCPSLQPLLMDIRDAE